MTNVHKCSLKTSFKAHYKFVDINTVFLLFSDLYGGAMVLWEDGSGIL